MSQPRAKKAHLNQLKKIALEFPEVKKAETALNKVLKDAAHIILVSEKEAKDTLGELADEIEELEGGLSPNSEFECLPGIPYDVAVAAVSKKDIATIQKYIAANKAKDYAQVEQDAFDKALNNRINVLQAVITPNELAAIKNSTDKKIVIPTSPKIGTKVDPWKKLLDTMNLRKLGYETGQQRQHSQAGDPEIYWEKRTGIGVSTLNRSFYKITKQSLFDYYPLRKELEVKYGLPPLDFKEWLDTFIDFLPLGPELAHFKKEYKSLQNLLFLKSEEERSLYLARMENGVLFLNEKHPQNLFSYDSKSINGWRQASTTTECGFMEIKTLPNEKMIVELPVQYDRAYLFYNDHLYYFHREHKKITPVPLTPQILAAIKKWDMSDQYRTLSFSEFNMIKRTKGHTPDERKFPFTLTSHRTNENQAVIFVFDPDSREMFIVQDEPGHIHHNYFFGTDKNVIAGHIQIEHGKITIIGNESGHYRNIESDFEKLICYLADLNMLDKIHTIDIFYKTTAESSDSPNLTVEDLSKVKTKSGHKVITGPKEIKDYIEQAKLHIAALSPLSPIDPLSPRTATPFINALSPKEALSPGYNRFSLTPQVKYRFKQIISDVKEKKVREKEKWTLGEENLDELLIQLNNQLEGLRFYYQKHFGDNHPETVPEYMQLQSDITFYEKKNDLIKNIQALTDELEQKKSYAVRDELDQLKQQLSLQQSLLESLLALTPTISTPTTDSSRGRARSETDTGPRTKLAQPKTSALRPISEGEIKRSKRRPPPIFTQHVSSADVFSKNNKTILELATAKEKDFENLKNKYSNRSALGDILAILNEEHHPLHNQSATTVAQAFKVLDELYVRYAPIRSTLGLICNELNIEKRFFELPKIHFKDIAALLHEQTLENSRRKSR